MFVFLSSPFFPLENCFRRWSKINLKAYDVINCLNKNLVTHFVWYLKRLNRNDIETLSIERVLKKNYNHTENVHKKLVSDPFLILVNNPKQTLHVRNSFEIRYFERGLSKSLNLYFFFQSQSLLMDKIMTNKRGMELVISRSSDYKASSEKFLC